MLRLSTYDNLVVNLNSRILCRESHCMNCMSWMDCLIYSICIYCQIVYMVICIYPARYMNSELTVRMAGDCQFGNWEWVSVSSYVENESQYRILNLRMRHISIWEWEFSIWECDMYQSQNETVSVSEWDCLNLRLRILKMRIPKVGGECDLIRPGIYCLIACPLDGSSRPYMKIGAQSKQPCTPNTSER